MSTHTKFLYAEKLLEKIRTEMPEAPILYGNGINSQTDEDGIIAHILGKISQMAPIPKTFIEFGCGNGVQNNTAALLYQGFKGCWIDGNPQNIQYIQSGLGGLEFPKLKVMEARVVLENVIDIVEDCLRFLGTEEVDFLNMDLDGNDWHFMKAIMLRIHPKLICAEYQPKCPPPLDRVMPYNAGHVWDGSDYYGCSLQAYVRLLQGYTLVSCNLSGFNAFFVRNDYACLFPYYPPEKHFRRVACDMCGLYDFQRPSLQWIRDAVKE